MKKTDQKYRKKKNEPGAGRPRLPEDQKMVQVSLSIRPSHRAKLAAYPGHGGGSKLLRRILDDHLDRYIASGISP